MNKGAKRKRSQEEEEEKKGASNTTATNASPQQEKKKGFGGRAKKAKHESKLEPEFLEDQRNLEDLWKLAFPVGTEWDKLDKVYEFNWDFSYLENAFEEGGVLHGKKVYLFACSEPQIVRFNGEDTFILVPAVVAVESQLPPSDKIGVASVQRACEELIPMKQMKMDWVPYMALKNRDGQVDRFKSQIFILSCTQRKCALKHLRIELVKEFEYCLPYLYNPLKEDELEQSSEVQIIFPAEPYPVLCKFNWESDELEELVNRLIEKKQLSEDQKDSFKDYVKEKVREAKRAIREAREARKKALEDMDEEIKLGYERMKLYKFYPVQTPDTPNISGVKVKFINRYYGKADELL